MEIIPAVKVDTEENSGYDCIICLRKFDFNEKENACQQSEKVCKIFKACSSYLKPEVFTNSSNWDCVKISEKTSPFCRSCFISGEKLSCMDERLNTIQKKIGTFVDKFSQEILKYRKDEQISIDLATPVQIKTDVATVESLIIKEEHDWDAELPDETADDPFPFPDSHFLSPEHLGGFNTAYGEKNVVEKVSADIDQQKIGERCKTRLQLKKLSIPLQRLQFDSGTQKKISAIKDVVIKSDIPENDSGSDFENCYDKSDADEDSWSDSSDASSPKRKKRRIQPSEKSRLNRQKKVDKSESDDANSEYPCQECEKIFASRQNLNSHIRYKHNTSTKRFVCKTCGKECRLRKLYLSHMQIHLRSYTCEECGETFEGEGPINKYKYEIHCLAHKNEIPYGCQFCPEKFSNVASYGNHLKFSSCGKTDMQLLNCELCEKTFYYKYLLLLHQVDHSPLKRGTGEIECKLCERKFRNNKYLTSVLEPHYLSHTEEYLLKCDICLMPVRDKHILNQHRQTHKPDFIEPEFPCEHCSKMFASLVNLKYHLQNIHNESKERFTCKVCQKEFRIKKIFTQHVKSHSTSLPCTICKRIFKTAGALNMHMRAHSGEFACKECGVKCEGEHSLKVHISVVHRKEKRFICELCGQGYYYLHDYNAHMKRHSEQKTFNCETCGSTFSREFDFKSHMKIHTGKGLDSSECPFICDVCGKFFKCKQGMQQHHDVHHSGITLEFKCDQCDKIFNRKNGLRKHIKRVHVEPQDLDLPCEVCGGKYRNETALKSHMKQHTVSIPCGICDKTFHTAGGVRIHRLQHTGELFPCKKCDKKFSSSTTLKTHDDAVHLKIFRHFCEVCGKGFYKRTGYLGHLGTHSDEKTCQCKECGEWFNTRHKLNDHRRKMHSGESFECQPCGKSFLRKATLNMHMKKRHSNDSTLNSPQKMSKRRKKTPIENNKDPPDQGRSTEMSIPQGHASTQQSQPVSVPLYQGQLHHPVNFSRGNESMWWFK